MLIRVSIAKGSMTVKIKQNRFSTAIAVIIHIHETGWVEQTLVYKCVKNFPCSKYSLCPEHLQLQACIFVKGVVLYWVGVEISVNAN